MSWEVYQTFISELPKPDSDTIVKKYGVDFESEGGALTLPMGYVCSTKDYCPNDYELCMRQHDSGWLIFGCISQDYYRWVNEFAAIHAIYGNVWGNFEDEVYADSEEGFRHFMDNHTPEAWNYGDI